MTNLQSLAECKIVLKLSQRAADNRCFCLPLPTVSQATAAECPPMIPAEDQTQVATGESESVGAVMCVEVWCAGWILDTATDDTLGLIPSWLGLRPASPSLSYSAIALVTLCMEFSCQCQKRHKCVLYAVPFLGGYVPSLINRIIHPLLKLCVLFNLYCIVLNLVTLHYSCVPPTLHHRSLCTYLCGQLAAFEVERLQTCDLLIALAFLLQWEKSTTTYNWSV